MAREVDEEEWESYPEDPDYEDDASHPGPEGRLALHITGPSLDTTAYAINSGSHRDDGSIFDAFGMGMSPLESNTGIDGSKTMQFFIDDVIYSGVASISTVSLLMSPRSSADLIMLYAGLSFTLPPGLLPSSFAYTLTLGFGFSR